MAPTESVANAAEAVIEALPGALDRALLEELWRACDVASWGLAREEFDRILLAAGTEANYGMPEDAAATNARGNDSSSFTASRWCARPLPSPAAKRWAATWPINFTPSSTASPSAM